MGGHKAKHTSLEHHLHSEGTGHMVGGGPVVGSAITWGPSGKDSANTEARPCRGAACDHCRAQDGWRLHLLFL